MTDKVPPKSRLHRQADRLEGTGVVRFLTVATGAGLISALSLVVAGAALALAYHLYTLQIQDREEARILRAWSIIAASPGAEKGNIGQKEAIEFLHAHGKSLQRVNLSDALLRGAELPDADLQMANFERAILEHANLEGADLWRARLAGAFLSGARLQGARLEGAFLMGARLDGANLEGADLTQANLTGADLAGAKVTRNQLAKACGDRGTPPNVDEDVRPPEPWPQPCLRWQ